MDKKSTLTAEQRTQLVLRLLGREESAAQIARRAGVSEQALYRWREEFIAAGKQAMSGRETKAEQAKALERLMAEETEGEQVSGELTVANRLLNDSGALS